MVSNPRLDPEDAEEGDEAYVKERRAWEAEEFVGVSSISCLEAAAEEVAARKGFRGASMSVRG
jgi:hypothetical protein